MARFRDKYDHLIFDLDHTLWDFNKNSEETLNELFHEFDLKEKLGVAFEKMLDHYYEINDDLWKKYNKGKITKDNLRTERFVRLLKNFGVDDHALAEELDNLYLSRCPKKGHVVPGSIKVLTELREHYGIHIITNGFEETTRLKLEHSPIGKYVDEVVSSESAGVNKPDMAIFRYMLRRIGAHRERCMMIGDNYGTDILGAKRSAIDHVYFNYKRQYHEFKVDHEIIHLTELLNIL